MSKKVFCIDCLYYEKDLAYQEKCHALKNHGNYLASYILKYLPRTINSDNLCNWYKFKISKMLIKPNSNE